MQMDTYIIFNQLNIVIMENSIFNSVNEVITSKTSGKKFGQRVQDTAYRLFVDRQGCLQVFQTRAEYMEYVEGIEV
jgi:hypothetical protein